MILSRSTASLSTAKLMIVGRNFIVPAIASIAIAHAQMAGGGMGGALGPGGPINAGQGLHAPQRTQHIAPPALPGATGVGNISAGPVTTANENPTKLLFSAINHGDYTQARAAVSRGANLNARNALDETPIELAVELNRNNITFMLLSVRAEEGPPSASPLTVAPSSSARQGALAGKPIRAAASSAHRSPAATSAVPDQHSIPNPAAGFLGFGHS